MSYTNFKEVVWTYYKKCGRHDLPWRGTRNPYKILVSEIMLQQTQVERALPFYAEFTRRWPTARRLAKAPLSDVLKEWQGLGYNRRAKMLHATAKEIATHGMPQTAKELEKLPGVGRYTARAVAAFAFNADAILVETNIRTAVIHHFFKKKRVSDREIEHVLMRIFPKGKSRMWNWALMDYGAHLKQKGIRVNAQSTQYAKQSVFEGSLRQARGAVLRELAKGKRSQKTLEQLFGAKRRAQVRAALTALSEEALIQKRGRNFALAH